LPEAELGAVARLYGGFRPKYADLAYCRHLFNGNPHGYSFHAFLDDEGGEPVGHYAIIPMQVVVDGEVRLSGKAEALIVLPGHRRSTVPLENGTQALCGLVMPSRLYRFALDQGCDLVHMIPSPDVQAIYPATGARAVPGRHRRARLYVDPRGAVDPAATSARRVAQAVLGMGQYAAYTCARLLSGASSGDVLRWSGSRLTPDVLGRVAASVPSVPGWTLACDADHLAWIARTAHLEVIALDESLADFAVVTARAGEGRVLEVLIWRQRSAGRHAALRLLDAVARTARSAGDVVVGLSHTAAWDAGELSRLRGAARVLCFHERDQPADLFVSSRRKEYLDPARLRFSPLFYAIY